MNKRLDDAITRLKSLPDERQREAADLLLDFLEQDPSDIELTPERIAEIERRLAENDIATDEEVRTFFERTRS